MQTEQAKAVAKIIQYINKALENKVKRPI